MLGLYNHMLWFKTCRPVRIKYNLSTNILLMLVSCYAFNTLKNKPFTINQILYFITYYNPEKLKKYVNVLIDRGYVNKEYSNSSIRYYSISLAGLQVIKELNDSYEIELSKFCTQYNISL